MAGRVVDLAQHSRQRKESANGHAPKRPIPTRAIPTYPDIDADLLILASQQRRISDFPATAEGRVGVSVEPDDTWEVTVLRLGDGHPLVLRGTRETPAPVVLRQIVCWLYGVPA